MIGRGWRQLRAFMSGRGADRDLGTEAGRSSERYRKAALATVVSVVARGLNIVVLFVGIGIVAGAVSSDEFGIWILLVTAIALVGFADLGIGNGLLNVIADAQGRDDDVLTRQAISSAIVPLTALAAVLGLLYALVEPHVPWDTVFNVHTMSADQVGRAVTAFVFCTLISLPLGMSQRIHHAHQDGWIANAWLGVGSLISLAAVLAADAADAGVAALVFAMLIGPPIAYLVDSIILFGWLRPDLRPRRRHVRSAAAAQVLRSGILFFVLATVVAFSYEADSLIISHFLGADQVETYAVPFRLFALAPSLVIILVTPLWPAYGEAIARDDVAWVHRTLRRSMLVGASITVPISLVLIVAAPAIIHLWVGDHVNPPISVLLGIGTWAVINGVSTALATFFNGAGILRLQVAMAVAMGTANVVLSIVLVQHIGVAGPIWATVTTQVLFGIIPVWFLLRGTLGRSSTPGDLHAFVQRWGDKKTHPSDTEVVPS